MTAEALEFCAKQVLVTKFIRLGTFASIELIYMYLIVRFLWVQQW